MAISSQLGSSALLPAGLGFRNLIMNGDMRVNQRNTAITAGGYTTYTVDRWYVDNVDASVRSIAQNTDAPPGFGSSLRMTATTGATSSGILRFGQRIENLNCSNLAYGTSSAKPVAVSFWVKSSVVGTYAVRLQTGAQAYLAPYTINVANTWEYKTVFIPGNTTTVISDYLDVQFMIHAGSLSWGTSNQWLSSTLAYATSGQVNAMATTGNIFAITGVQVEQNLQPTPFEQRPIGVELALCQRYYQVIGGSATSFTVAGYGYADPAGTAFTATFQLITEMRTAPTIGLFGAPQGYDITVQRTITAITSTKSTTRIACGDPSYTGGTFNAIRTVWFLSAGSGTPYGYTFSAEL